MKPDLVIFDCDGTLVDSEPIDHEVVRELLAEAGVLSAEQRIMAETTGMSNADMWAEFERRTGRTIPASVVDSYDARVLRALAERVKAMPGALYAVSRIAADGTLICVASSDEHEKMDITLGQTGLLPYFNGHIFSATQVAHGKPAPDIFLFAAGQMAVPPERCAVIEDSVPGVRGGLAAGMETFAYCPHGDNQGLGALGAFVFADMAELPTLLDIR
jgi:HAD superfamily hydrolase (TIGR01509 family)